MKKFDYDSKFFDPLHTLDCGQIFRFEPFKSGFIVFSLDKACYLYKDGCRTVVESDDPDYFFNFFDLARDYSQIVKTAEESGFQLLAKSARAFSGLRLLNQNCEEMIYSFIISQNNNIPRIKGIISRICEGLGERKSFLGNEYYAFPTTRALSEQGADFFKNVGCGYRDKFLFETAQRIEREGVERLKNLSSAELTSELLTYKGIGEKVADCIALFGFSRRDRFPVDVWLEKVYKEDFNGSLTDRKAMSRYFTDLFGANSGYFQQYLFYGKRQNL